MTVTTSDIVFPNLRDSVSKANNNNAMGKSWYKSLLQTKGAILQLNSDIESATDSLNTQLQDAIDTLTALITTTGATAAPVATLRWSAANTVDTGWLLCDGSLVSRTTYSALFAAIGTTYGEGDGSTTFALPNPTDRMLIASGGFAANGDIGGSPSKFLTTANLPPHTHPNTAYDTATINAGGYSALGAPAAVFTATGNTGSTGSGEAFDIMPPYFGAKLLIKT